eukprot:gene23059-28172_t
MVAAVELEDLHVSHGLVHNVCGFDHSPLDRVQAEWHEFIYPYYLANYRKRLLTRPVKLATLDYYTLSEQFDSILQQIVKVQVDRSGSSEERQLIENRVVLLVVVKLTIL